MGVDKKMALCDIDFMPLIDLTDKLNSDGVGGVTSNN